MSCVILTTKEIIYQTVEWIPIELEAASKENQEINRKYNSPISPGERINPETKKKEKKHYDERTSTFFSYDIPTGVQSTKLIEELNKLFNITDMIEIFSGMGYNIKQILSNTVHNTTIYTKYILTKNHSINSINSSNSNKPNFKKKNYNGSKPNYQN